MRDLSVGKRAVSKIVFTVFKVDYSVLMVYFMHQGLAVIGSLIGGAAGLAYTLDQSVKASGLELHAPQFPWSHNGLFSSLDHARYLDL